MLRVTLDQFKPDMKLARPISTPEHPTRYLVQRDQTLNSNMLKKLRQYGIRDVWIRFDELDFLDETVDPDLHRIQLDTYNTVRKGFERAMNSVEGKLDVEPFVQSVRQIFEYMKFSSRSLILIDRIQQFDNHLFAHSTNVCYLAMLMGIELQSYIRKERIVGTDRHDTSDPDKDIRNMGIGSLLHDIGKIRIDLSLQRKHGPLTEKEMMEMEKHTAIGYSMVRGHIASACSQVVLNHHQRWDGSGYPLIPNEENGKALALKGKRINIGSRIAGLADVYDAAVSSRKYSDPKPPIQALWEISRFQSHQFDPIVYRTLFRVAPPFPIGSQVELNDGLIAAVLDFNQSEPCRPLVKPIRYEDGEPCTYPDTMEIDLAEFRDLYIKKVGSIDVRPFLFESPQSHLQPSIEKL